MALTDKLTAIANAIRAKTGKTGKLSLTQMATEISQIPEYPHILNMFMRANQVLGNGGEVMARMTTGSIEMYDDEDNDITDAGVLSVDASLLDSVDMRIPCSEFGNASAEEVVSGKTFTSSAGFKKAGTHVCPAGLPSGISALDFGTINIDTAFTTTRQTFNHNLGVVPDLMIVWSPVNIATTYSMLAAVRGNQWGWRSSAYNNHYAYHGNSTTTVTWTNSNSTTYGISSMTATTFQLASSSSSYYWRAGTYNYIAIKFG